MDSDSSLHAPRATGLTPDRHEPRHRLAVPRKDDLLAGLDAFEQPRQMRLGFVNVDGLHNELSLA